MKIFVFSAFLLSLASLPSFASDCGADEQEGVDLAKKHFSAGEATRSDVDAMLIALAEAKKACGEMSQADYCKAVLEYSKVIFEGTQEEARLGQKTDMDVLKAKIAYHQYVKACANQP